MIQTLIFDLGNVLVPFDFRRGYAEMEKVCSCPVDEIPGRIGSELPVRFESGQIGPEEFVEEIKERLNLDVSYREFCRIFSMIFLPDPLIPESLLAGLKERYPLVLLSNTNAIHWEMLHATYPLLSLFDHRVLSFEVGAMKPSPRIYAEAVARAGHRPEDCFFVDDVQDYVEGARQAGLDAVRFTSLERLRKDLLDRGVEV